MIDVDVLRVIERPILEYLFKIKGFTLREPLEYDGKTLFMPDFYPDRYVIAASHGALIICSGESAINYRDQDFDSVEELVATYGRKEIENYADWEFRSVKEWAVLGLDNRVRQYFTNPIMLKTTKQLRC